MDKRNVGVYPFVGRFILVVNLIKLNNMKNFDLTAAKAGAPVCTREGKGARIICADRRGYPASVIIALLDDGDREGVEFYYADGRWGKDKDRKEDLMMRDDDYAEKLARGEYGNHIDEATEKVDPTIKENLKVGREYWRRVYAGQAMQGQISGYLASGSGFNGNKSIPGIVAKSSVMIADALIAELEKKEKDG